jgi:hypothetical protein
VGLWLLLPLFFASLFRVQVSGDGKFMDLRMQGILLFFLIVFGCLISIPGMYKIGGGVFNLALLNAFCVMAVCWCINDALQHGIAKKLWVLGAFFYIGQFAYGAKIGGVIARRTPSAYDAEQYELLVNFVRNEPGPVWHFIHPAVNFFANKEVFVPIQQLAGEWFLGGHELTSDIIPAIDAKYFSSIITEGYGMYPWASGPIYQALERHYLPKYGLLQNLNIHEPDGNNRVGILVWQRKQG